MSIWNWVKKLFVKKKKNKIVAAITSSYNLNGRKYDPEAMKRAVREFDKIVKTGTAFGTMNNVDCSYGIPLEDISHVVTGIDIGDKELIINAEILATPKGRVICNLIKEGASPKFQIIGHKVGDKIDISSISVGFEEEEEGGDKC